MSDPNFATCMMSFSICSNIKRLSNERKESVIFEKVKSLWHNIFLRKNLSSNIVVTFNSDIV